jgi:hypothetical protein
MARPQQVSDEAIVAIIEELRQPHRAPSGVQVREQLWARFGIRASTQRVYWLLKAPPPQPPPIDPSEAARQIADLTAERNAQIDALRQRLKRLGADPYA